MNSKFRVYCYATELWTKKVKENGAPFYLWTSRVLKYQSNIKQALHFFKQTHTYDKCRLPPFFYCLPHRQQTSLNWFLPRCRMASCKRCIRDTWRHCYRRPCANVTDAEVDVYTADSVLCAVFLSSCRPNSNRWYSKQNPATHPAAAR